MEPVDNPRIAVFAWKADAEEQVHGVGPDRTARPQSLLDDGGDATPLVLEGRVERPKIRLRRRD
jgi:hypothetical protein